MILEAIKNLFGVVGSFDQSHGKVLEALADASATAIENAQRFEQANREITERKPAEKKLKKMKRS